jgi:hypothetical protein
MKSSIALAVLAVSFVAVAAEPAKKTGTAVVIPAAEVKWTDVAGAPGVKMAVPEGDAATGAHHSFLKFAAGFAAPVHHHTTNHYGTVLAGTIVLTVDGKEQKLPAGSYFSFTGMKEHATRCDVGADCLLFIDARQQWDVVAAPEAPKPAKK